MLIPADTFQPDELAWLQDTQEAQLAHRFLVQRQVPTTDDLLTTTEQWLDVETVAGSLTRTTRQTEEVVAGILRAVTVWKLTVPWLTDLQPRDRVLQHGRFSVGTGGATAGTFTLSYNGQTTAALAYNAAAATIQAALEGLSTIGAGNVAVRGRAGGPWTVTLRYDLQEATVALTGSGAGLTAGTLSLDRPVFQCLDTDAGKADATLLTASVVRLWGTPE
jgi:hypothetical protein